MQIFANIVELEVLVQEKFICNSYNIKTYFVEDLHNGYHVYRSGTYSFFSSCLYQKIYETRLVFIADLR